MSKHHWWHSIWGKEAKTEEVFKDGNTSVSNCWYVCKKCGEQIGDKVGISHLSFPSFSVKEASQCLRKR